MASIPRIYASDKTGDAAVATVQTLRLPGASTIVVDTVENIPAFFMGSMGTPHTFVDPITSEEITVISEATAVDFAGHVDSTNLIIDTIAPGYADTNGSAVGDIVIIRPTTQYADNLADVLAAVHNDDGTLKSSLTITTPSLTSPVFQGTITGWNLANESWAYASATTITVPTGAASKYSVGDKIKLTQTTVKYFYIVGVADTVLTITGGADYTLTNAVISANYYSHSVNPVGFPDWFNYTPTWTGFSSATPSGGVVRFKITGRTVQYNIGHTTAATSNATSTTITLPVTAATITNARWRAVTGQATDNGAVVSTAGEYDIASAGTTAALFSAANGNNWTASGNKMWMGLITYEI